MRIFLIIFILLFNKNSFSNESLNGLFGLNVGEYFETDLKLISIDSINEIKTEEELFELDQNLEDGFFTFVSPPIANKDFYRYFITISPISGSVGDIYAYSNSINYNSCIERQDYYIKFFVEKYSKKYNGKYNVDSSKWGQQIEIRFYEEGNKNNWSKLNLFCESDVTRIVFKSHLSVVKTEIEAVRQELRKKLEEIKRKKFESADTSGF